MRSFLILFLSLLFPLLGFTQEVFNFSGLQGIKMSNNDIYFELRGYDIYTTSFEGDLNALTSNKILTSRIDLGDNLVDYNEVVGNVFCRIIESEVASEYGVDIKLNQAVYFADKLGGEVIAIQFKTYNQRDFVTERAFVQAFIEKELDGSISDSWSASSIDFVGQKIKLGDECIWAKPHHVKCGDAQISWSEYISMEDAILDIDNRIRLYDTNSYLIEEENDIEVFFEGVSTMARRVVFRNIKEIDNPFQIYYYLVQGVNNRFVSCVLSNPAYNKKEYGLAPLLEQVMSIPNLPSDAYVVKESDYIEADSDGGFSPSLEIQASSWMAVGQLKEVFSWAPTIGLVLKFPIKHQMSVDVGIQLGPPLNKGSFEYKMNGDYYETESDFLFNMSLRFRKSKTFSKHYCFGTYLGVGLNGLQTDVEKWDYDEEINKVETLATVDVFGGMSLQYKKMSIFAEYHYTPYNISNKVKSNFGHTALNLGLSYTIVWK